MSANPNKNILTAQGVIEKLNSGTNVFLTGGAGVGKSYTLNIVKEAFKNPIVLAPTGIAASHIKGETIHSFFEFPVDKDAGIRALSGYKKELYIKIFRKCDLLIIDEISMVGDYLLNWIDIRLSELGVNIPILIVGDFYQLPPVSSDGSVAFAYESIFWKKHNFETVELEKIYRTENVEFAKILQDLRLGNVTKEAAIMIEKLSSNSDSDEYTHLYSTNNDAFWHNKKMLDKIKKRNYVYDLVDEFVGDSDSKTEKSAYEFKKKALKSRFENKLFLKEGATVMYTVNKKELNIYNGKKGVITKLTDDKIFVDGNEIEKELLELYIYKPRQKDGKKYVEKKLIGRIYQYPIKLAYAITIHKSQGMSIDGLSINLRYIFASGQGYVALSRAINPDTTYIKLGFKPLEEVFYADDDVKRFYGHDVSN